MFSNQKWPLHLNIQDSSGDAAVIEFINDKKVIYHGPQYIIWLDLNTLDFAEGKPVLSIDSNQDSLVDDIKQRLQSQS
ncbi:Penicillin V acylase and related amidases [Legionella beliardensis]|uniref:Penicillin V acylase and related amidases n=1 Tax=Legionella beliardensis TaxID=91822 RepID=A0A378I3F1_9GAMM|nr:hypothetical protein [Legionella beliardensis]STX29216.1 Penicillin V acylase and related amidases [Legionella beliardensis]